MDTEYMNTNVEQIELDDDTSISDDIFEEAISDEIVKELDSLEQSSGEEEDDSENKDTDTTDSPSKKKKKKKTTKKDLKKQDPFYLFCKIYLSSLIARSSKYAVLHLDPAHMDTLILVSGRNKMTFDEYLLQYVPGDLAIHIVNFAHNELDIFKQRLQITTDAIFLINLQAIRKAVNAAMKDKEAQTLPITFMVGTDHHLYLRYTDITKVDEFNRPTIEIERYGVVYDDWRTICILSNLVKKMETLSQRLDAVIEKVTYEDLMKYNKQNVIMYPVETIKYTRLGYPLTFDLDHRTPLIFLDGKDIVSKEYLKKMKEHDYELTLLSSANPPNLNIEYCSIYHDNNVNMVSSRPLTCTYPHIFSEGV